jgi:ABC-type transport system involved in multi-copper enzyme maturation permease subunit
LIRHEPTSGYRLGDWLRRELTLSAFRRSWRPRLAVALLLAGVLLLAWFGGWLTPWQQVALWGVLLIVGAYLGRRGWLTLFGPVLFYDLVRSARQSRTFLLRGTYAFALLVVLFLVYSDHINHDDLFGEAHVDTQELTRFASGFFLTFLSVQFGAVFLLTPIFTATAIAEEKERKTLEYLLVSDLQNREIVLGKLASRLLAMLLLLVSGLPVLSFVQFLGGVDPNLVLAGFAATVMTMLSLGSLGIANSVYADRPRGAIFSTYVMAGGYLLASSCCAPASSVSGLGWISAGNIFVAYYHVTSSAGTAGGTTGAAVLSVLTDCVIFHAVAAAVLSGLATLKLRAWNRESRPQSEHRVVVVPTGPRPGSSVIRITLRLPRIGKDSILWKELYAEPGYRLHPLARSLLLFAGGVLGAGAAVTYLCGLALSLSALDPGEFVTNWVRVVGTSIASVMVLAVAVRGSTSLASERDRQTLDSLLTTPLSSSALLRSKWLGAILSVRQGWWFLGAAWLLGFLAGGLHPLSLLLLAASWWVFAAFAVGLGLWFSLHSRSTLRATVWTLVTLLVISAAPVLLCGNTGLALLTDPSPGGTTSAADLFALTPPGAMFALAFGWGKYYSFDPEVVGSLAVRIALACVCAYAVAAVALKYGVLARFGPVTGRMPDR